MSSQVYAVAGTYTFTWPSGITSLIAEGVGCGGPGGTASGNPATGGGGAGGCYSRTTITKGAESVLFISVPAGGSGTTIQPAQVARTNAAGEVVLLAPGGGYGAAQAASSANGAGATDFFNPPSGSAIGDVKYVGGNGGTGNFTSGVGGSGAGGGAAGPTGAGASASGNLAGAANAGTWGDGGVYSGSGRDGVGNTLVGLVGWNYGGGGSGGKANSNTDKAGGTGGGGLVVLTWIDPPTTLNRGLKPSRSQQGPATLLGMDWSAGAGGGVPAIGQALIIFVEASCVSPVQPMVFQDGWVTDNGGNPYYLAVGQQHVSATDVGCAIYYCPKVVVTGTGLVTTFNPGDGVGRNIMIAGREITGLVGSNTLGLVEGLGSSTNVSQAQSSTRSSTDLLTAELVVATMVVSNSHLLTSITNNQNGPSPWFIQEWEYLGVGTSTYGWETDIRLKQFTSEYATCAWTLVPNQISANVIAIFQQAGPQGPRGTLNQTLANATLAATGSPGLLARVGTLTQTLNSATCSAAGVVVPMRTGTVVQTLANATCSAAGTITAVCTATVAQTLASATLGEGGGAGPDYAATVVADGASYYWRLGETSGTTADDAVGATDGTILGGVTLNQPGALADGNPAMTFDGTSGLVECGATGTITLPAVMSVEAWVKYVNDGTYQPIFSGSNSQPMFFIEATGELSIYDFRATVFDGTVVPPGTWHHVVCVLTGTTVTLYRDGVQDKTGAFARPSFTGFVEIGSDRSLGGTPDSFFNGSIDEVAVYPVALTPAQVAAHYALASAQPVAPATAMVNVLDTATVSRLLPNATLAATAAVVGVARQPIAMIV